MLKTKDLSVTTPAGYNKQLGVIKAASVGVLLPFVYAAQTRDSFACSYELNEDFTNNFSFDSLSDVQPEKATLDRNDVQLLATHRSKLLVKKISTPDLFTQIDAQQLTAIDSYLDSEFPVLLNEDLRAGIAAIDVLNKLIQTKPPK